MLLKKWILTIKISMLIWYLQKGGRFNVWNNVQPSSIIMTHCTTDDCWSWSTYVWPTPLQ